MGKRYAREKTENVQSAESPWLPLLRDIQAKRDEAARRVDQLDNSIRIVRDLIAKGLPVPESIREELSTQI